MMAWPGRELAIAPLAQHPAECLLADRDTELGKDPLCQVDQPPAHHPVHRWVGAGLDDPLQHLALLGVQQRSLPRRLAVDQPGGPCTLNAATQSRTVCRCTPPIAAAAPREAPS